jgi:hypothetical protein
MRRSATTIAPNVTVTTRAVVTLAFLQVVTEFAFEGVMSPEGEPASLWCDGIDEQDGAEGCEVRHFPAPHPSHLRFRPGNKPMMDKRSQSRNLPASLPEAR